MGFIRNLLALIGLLAIIGVVYGYQKFGSDINALGKFDSQFRSTYSEMWAKLKETGNFADAMVWVLPLEDDVSVEDAEAAMKIIADKLNIKAMGEWSLSGQVEGETGEKQRYLKIYQYCDPQTVMKMMEHSDAFAAYLPCRVSIVEGKDGIFRLYSLNMDLIIHGGAELPADLKQEALKIKATIQKIMASGAAGDFLLNG